MSDNLKKDMKEEIGEIRYDQPASQNDYENALKEENALKRVKAETESKKQEEKDKRDYKRIEILRDVIKWSLKLLCITLFLGLTLFFLSRFTDIGAALTDTRTEFHFLSLLTAGLLAIITTCIGLIGGSSIK